MSSTMQSGINEKTLWLLRRAFSCGVSPAEFKAKCEKLDSKNVDAVVRVARRLGLANKIRYELRFNESLDKYSEENFFVRRFEIPTLELFLLFSCLDTLAGQGHKNFQEWLKTEEFSLLDRGGIEDLWGRYSDSHGVGKKLRNLFLNLPTATQNWLVENVTIQESGKIDVDRNLPEELMNLLYEYFYNLCRNPFAHDSRSTNISLIEEQNRSDNEWISPNWYFSFRGGNNKKKTKWSLYHKTSTDLTMILRLILNAVVLQKLSISYSQNVLQKQLAKIDRLHFLYQFVAETHWNAEQVSRWGMIDLHDYDTRDEVLHRGFPRLSAYYSKCVVQKLESNPFESNLRSQIEEYINSIELINTQTRNSEENFDKTNMKNAWENAIGLLGQISRTPLADTVRKEPYRLYRVWELLRDPCYA